MNELTLGREPVELAEIVLPRCVNTYGVGICTATGVGDAKCYKTRATCDVPNSYRASPVGHLQPDVILANGEDVTDTTVNRAQSLLIRARVRFSSSPDGVIYEQGGSAGRGTYLGVTSGDLVWRAGDGTVASGANTGKVSVDASAYAGKTMDVIAEIDFTPSSISTVNLWIYDIVDRQLTFLGTDDFTAAATWAGTGAGGIGVPGGAEVVTGESASPWNGFVLFANFYENTTTPADMPASYSRSVWLGYGDAGEPTSQIKILPFLRNMQTLGSRINIANSEDSYEPFGRLAYLEFSCADAPHSGIGEDPHLADRETDPRTLSTYWRKWLQREKYGRVGATVRIYTGYAGQKISDYRVRSYVLDSAAQNENTVKFSCRDPLSRTELEKAKVPAESSGILDEDMPVDALIFRVFGNVLSDYPVTGVVRIDDEVIRYSSRSYVASPNYTEFLIDGLQNRGLEGSEIEEHDQEDLVQLCREYVDAKISDVVIGLLCDDAAIPAQLINVAKIEQEDTFYLSALRINTLLTEPRSVSGLLGQLSIECGFYIWWNERDQFIDLQAIRGLDIDEDIGKLLTYESNIVANSLRQEEKPRERLNIVTIYYSPNNITGDLESPANFKKGLQLINGTTTGEDLYGDYVQTKEIFSIFLRSEATVNQVASRLALRYADVPNDVELMVDARDQELWVGQFIQIAHPDIVLPSGERDIRRYLIVEAEEVEAGHLIKYGCTDVTLDGLIYNVTANGIGNYTAALFAEGNAFITDNDGLNSDGSSGATIS